MSQAANFNIITSPPAPIGGQTTRISESFAALLTRNSGSSGTRPAYITTAGKGEWTQEVSGTNWALYYFDGTHDVLLGTINPTTGAFTSAGDMSALGGAAWGAETSIASAATTTLASVSTYRALVTGTVTITSFGTGVNLRRQVRFSGVLTLTHNGTSLILPGAQDITTVAGDIANFESDGSSNWRCVNYFRDGVPLWMREAEASIASATTTDLSTKRSRYINVTGTVTITGFGTGANLDRVVRFSGALTLTYNATSLILPTAANITTAAGDIAFLRSDGSGNWRCLNYVRADGTPLTGPKRPGYVNNIEINATVASNALTIALKTDAGGDASAADVITAVFPSASEDGTMVTRTLTAALNLVISNGSDVGATVNSEAFRLWIVLFDDAGTLRLGAINCRDRATNSIYGLASNGIASATNEGGAGTADAAQTFYSNATVTSKPFIVIGYLEYTTGLAAHGVYGAAPSKVHLQKAGDPLPNHVVQTKVGTTSAEAAISATTYTVTGNKVTGYTNFSACNVVKLTAIGALYAIATGTPAAVAVRLHKDGTAISTIPAQELYLNTASGGNISSGAMIGFDFPGDASSHTYEVYGKGGTNTTIEYPEQTQGNTVGVVIAEEITS